MAVVNNAHYVGRSEASRKVVTHRKMNFTGWVFSKKNECLVAYESLLERDYIQLVEVDPNVKSYREQPEPLTWSDGHDTYRTTFDFAVTRHDGARYLVEIKPFAKVVKYGLDELYGFVRHAAKRQGYDGFELWTDREIRATPRLGNAELLVSANTAAIDRTDEMTMQICVRLLRKNAARVSIGELRASSGLGPKAYWQILRMVAAGQLVPADRSAALNDAAVLVISGKR